MTTKEGSARATIEGNDQAIRDATIVEVDHTTSRRTGQNATVTITVTLRAQGQGKVETTSAGTRHAKVLAEPLHTNLANREEPRADADTVDAVLACEPGREWTMPRGSVEIAGRGTLFWNDGDAVTVRDVLTRPAYFSAKTHKRAEVLAQTGTEALIRGLVAGTELTLEDFTAHQGATVEARITSIRPPEPIARIVEKLAKKLAERRAQIARLRENHARLGTEATRCANKPHLPSRAAQMRTKVRQAWG